MIENIASDLQIKKAGGPRSLSCAKATAAPETNRVRPDLRDEFIHPRDLPQHYHGPALVNLFEGTSWGDAKS